MTIEMKHLCRLCGDFSDLELNIFHSDSGIKLAENIVKYLSITIDTLDGLPKHVCQSCQDIVANFDEFAVGCVKLQTILNNCVCKNVGLGDNIWESIKDNIQEISYEKEGKIKTGKNSTIYPDQVGHEIKIEITEEISIKHEDDSDWCNGDNNDYDENNDDGDEDYLPASKYIHRKKREVSSCLVKKRVGQKSIKNYHRENLKKTPTQKQKKSKLFINDDFKYNFICHICADEFFDWAKLEAHTIFFHSCKPNVLCICSKYLHSRKSFHRHREEHQLKFEKECFKCNVCDKEFKSEKSLYGHSISHMPKEEYPFVCSHCAKRFSSIRSLQKHENIHIPLELRQKLPCSHCHLKFSSKSALHHHLKFVNSSLSFVCDTCGKAFRDRGYLQAHLAVHSDVKNYPCTKCLMKFKTKARLRKHMDCHSDTSYPCNICTASLNSRETLRNHMLIHTDLCKYVCNLCNKKYKRRKALKSHMNLHTGERPHECPWCPKVFIDNSNLRNHKKRMHSTELAEYEAVHGPPKNNSTPRNNNEKITLASEALLRKSKIKVAGSRPQCVKLVNESSKEN